MDLDISDATLPLDAKTIMGLLATKPRLLALGEPTHGEDTLLEVRNELFYELVEHEGYRRIAIESDCLLGLIVDDYVTGADGSLDEAMAQGFSHGFGSSAANRELVRWMHEYNDDRPGTEQLRFDGFDAPLEMTGAASPRSAVRALFGYLSARPEPNLLPCTWADIEHLLGADARWTNPAAMMDPAQSVGQSLAAQELQGLVDALVTLLHGQTPQLMAATSPQDVERALLYARTATGLLRYHHAIADVSPSRMTKLVALRDELMAENLLAIAERSPTLVFAHNGHLQRPQSTMRMGAETIEWWSAGAIAGAQLGEEYAFFATALGTIENKGVPLPPPDTIEGILYGLADRRCLVDARGLAAALAGTPPVARVSPYYGYAALDPAHLADVEGIVFVADV